MRSFYTKIVGVTFDNSNGTSRQSLIADLDNLPCDLQLERQQENPHDCNAVAVLDPQGRQLGYLSRAVADQIARLLDLGSTVQVQATQVTGGWPFNYGVNLRLEY